MERRSSSWFHTHTHKSFGHGGGGYRIPPHLRTSCMSENWSALITQNTPYHSPCGTWPQFPGIDGTLHAIRRSPSRLLCNRLCNHLSMPTELPKNLNPGLKPRKGARDNPKSRLRRPQDRRAQVAPTPNRSFGSPCRLGSLTKLEFGKSFILVYVRWLR